VELTIVSRSFSPAMGTGLSINQVFGLAASSLRRSPPAEPYKLSIETARFAAGFSALPDTSVNKNLITVYKDDDQSGFDAHALVFPDEISRQPLHLYLQMKIQPSTKEAMAKTVTRQLCFTLLTHMWRYGYSGPDSLKNVHFVYYNWGLGRPDSSNPVTRSAYTPAKLKAEILACLTKKSPSKYVDGEFEDWIQPKKALPHEFDTCVNRFVDEMTETNVHVVDGPVLDGWLLPSFLAFPLMFTALGVE
jgi:hypothetical protein